MSKMQSENSNNQRFKKSLEHAIRLDQKRRRNEALHCLAIITHQYPNRAAAWGYLAKIHFERGSMAQAAENFRRATELTPRSETASLGLFHSLWSLGAETEAVSEMRRFLSIADSAEYGRLLRDWTVEGRLVPQSQFAHAH